MQSKQDGLVPIGEALADLGGPVAALRDASPQALYHSAPKGFARSSVGRSAVQPAQSTSVSGWTSPGAYRRR